ncbi:T-complex protein 11-like protein 1 isoform X2 [Spea bombifrons]|uniref:T-complex protein 11-like protein 1 isoform X2 n=1 Tax=Spea bombifrons TaxID=233779 RepID=UPI00234B30DA|nr:T-complex protein 11-like protein 1 isoform X2 [Spea bombifrons]
MPLDPDQPNPKEDASCNPDKARDDESFDISQESVRKRIQQNTPSPHGENTLQTSPPQFVSEEELMEAAKGVTNMALAHEIVVSGGFQIKPVQLPDGSLEKRVRDILHKAFWDCLEAQFREDPPVYGHAIILLGEIKEALTSFLLPGHTRLRNQINEVLDLDLIKQEAENRALNISKLAEFIIGMMGTLCSPARDEEIKKLRDIKEPVSLFRAIFSVLDLMKLDMANFAISSIRPHLMQQSVEYERKKFQDFFDKKTNALEFVTQWLQESARDLETLQSKNSEHLKAEAAPASMSPVSVLNHAYMKLLTWDHQRRLFPETVLMDQTRFQEMQQELVKLTQEGTLLLIIHNSTGSALSGLPGFTDRMKALIRVLLQDVDSQSNNAEEIWAMLSEKICMEVNTTLTQHGFTPISGENLESFKGQIQAAVSPSNHIYRLIESRVHMFLLSYLFATNQRPLPVIPGGLGPLHEELERTAVKFARLVNYNKMVFSPYYDSILGVILNK